MIYPNSNLPTVSQAWGRAIQKGIETLEATVNSNDINNRARDAQLQANYVQTNKNIQDIKFALTSSGIAVTGVNEIKNAIYVPGTTKIDGGSIQTGTLSATKISGGTIDASVSITGATINSASSGSRVEISGTSLKIHDNSGTVATLYGDAGGFFLAGSGGSFDVNSSGASINSGTNSVDVLSSGIVVNGTTTINDLTYLYGPVESNDTADFYGAVWLRASAKTTGIVNTGSITSTGTISTAGGLQRTVYSGGGTTGASVDNNGTFIRTSSSARYKQDIQDADYTYESVLGLQPKSFRLKNEAAEDDNAIFYPGFVAEELAGTDLDIFVSYETLPDGTKRPDGVRYAELTSALVSALKHQDGLIQSLTARIEVLESKV